MRALSIGMALFAALAVASAATAAEPVRIVAAENFYGDLASDIGGAHVEVTSILSNPDQDPHLFETSPSDARAITDAAIVIYNAAGYDPWMEKLLSASPGADRTSIVAAGLTGHKDGDNPHLWYEPGTLPKVAAAVAAALEKRDPEHAADYRANLEKFDSTFAPVTAEIEKIRANHAGTTVTATEPVFGYMAMALGFKMLNDDFQRAVMNDTEPSPRQVADFEQSLKSGEVKILFYNSQVTDDTTARLLKLAKDNNVKVVGVTETEPAGKSVAGWFLEQLGQVEDALKP